jgi:hypothetical protein
LALHSLVAPLKAELGLDVVVRARTHTQQQQQHA